MDPPHIPILFLLVVCIAVAKVASDSEELVSNDSFFNLKSKDKVQMEKEEHRRVKRADVSQIKHLHNTDRISEHSQEEKDAILAKHIHYRKNTDPEASNMEYMTWNEELAELAGLWASVCFWGHGMTDHTDLIDNFDSIGQNLWLGGGKPNGVGAVVSWHDNEVNNYIYEDASCKTNKVCGHYTQVVWANSKEVGCSRAFCAELIDNQGNLDGRTNLWMEACHYAPGGNYVGARPFKSGPYCTECSSGIGYCSEKACKSCPDDQADSCECRQVCRNCGTVTSYCDCECMDGWYGTSCSTKCEDTHENCWKSPGWPSPAYCGQHEAIPKGCPVMCGLCVPSDEECVTTKAPTGATTSPSTTIATTEPTTTTHSATTSVTTQSKSPTEPTDKPPTGCTNTCKHQGTLLDNCKCICPDDYTGELCERLIEEVVHGVELLFVEDISHFTDEIETTLLETVANVTTIYCNDNLQDCCDGDNSDINTSNDNEVFDFVSANDVVTGQGYPVVDPLRKDVFLTLVVIQVPDTTELCDSGSQSANRRKRDLNPVLKRNRRADSDTFFLDQDVLLKVIEENKDFIETKTGVTVDSVRSGEVTDTSSKKRGANAGVIAGAIVATFLVIIIITIIVIFVVKRHNSRQNKTEDDKWAKSGNGSQNPPPTASGHQDNNGGGIKA